MNRPINLTALFAIAVSLAGFASPAFAYLDPSTGSMILSAIVGIFATAGLAAKTYWYKLKSLFRGKSDQEVRESDADEGPQTQDSTSQ